MTEAGSPEEARGPEDTALVPEQARGIDMQVLMAAALEKGVEGVDALARLVELQEKMLDRQASMQFNSALAAFQAEVPVISKNAEKIVRPASGAPYTLRWASLDHVAEVIRPCMERHGLSYSFDSDVDEQRMKVTCYVRHVGGHAVPTTVSLRVDQRAKMSDPQQDIGAISYAARRALILSLGLNVGDVDDDGAASGAKKLSAEQCVQIEEWLSQFEDRRTMEPRFLKWATVKSIEDIPANFFDKSVAAIKERIAEEKSR